MKIETKAIIALLIGFFLLAANAQAVKILPEAQQNHNNLFEQWTPIYNYSDSYSEGKIKYLNPAQDIVEVTRTYAWRNYFDRMFLGKVKIRKTSDEYDWYGPRLGIVNPGNLLERYEIRFYPNTNKLQVNYVDRTNMTGDYFYDQENDLTTSEIITSTDCRIDTNKWYYTIIMKNGENWRVLVMSHNNPTCFVDWNDDRITGDKMAIGIQSAGKYVISRFSKVWSI